MNPLSFVVPCCNAGSHLAPLLRSLLAQSLVGLEIVLVDDASDDDSVATAEAVGGGRIRVERNAARLGIASNWNRALAATATPYVCIAHQDDLYEPDFAARMLAALEQSPKAAFAHCRARTIDDEGRDLPSAIEDFKADIWRRGLAGDGRQRLFARLLQGNFICCSSMVYRRAALADVGGFDPGLQFTLDWQMSLRLLLAGHDVAHVDATLIAYRRHRTNATRKHIATHDRYREELRTLAWAHATGQAAGLLPAGAPPSRAVRNNLLYDAYADLEHGHPDAARAKLRFGRDEVPGFRRDLMARIVAACVAAGPAGRLALRHGLRSYLALRRLLRQG